MAASEGDPPADGGSERVGERVRLYRRGATWYCNFQFGNRQCRESLRTASKKEARRRAARIDVQLTAGEWGPAVEACTVRQAADAYVSYLEAEGRAAKTMAKYRHVLGRVAALADARSVRDVAGLDLPFLDAYRKARVGDGAAEKTRYTECVILRQLIRFAVSRNLLAADPQKGAKLRKPKPTEQPCWTAGEVRTILAAAPGELRPALTLLAETGMRYGELAWLTWADIDASANVFHVRPKPGWKPKSGDRRAVPISPAARAVLDALPRDFAWVVAMPPSTACSEVGRQWTERRLLVGLKRVLESVGLVGKLHTFRHSFISNALLMGTAVAVVREWVGHVDPHVIDLYTHVHDAASQAAMKKLADAGGAGEARG